MCLCAFCVLNSEGVFFLKKIMIMKKNSYKSQVFKAYELQSAYIMTSFEEWHNSFEDGYTVI